LVGGIAAAVGIDDQQNQIAAGHGFADFGHHFAAE
jgi:hypothetical protein